MPQAENTPTPIRVFRFEVEQKGRYCPVVDYTPLRPARYGAWAAGRSLAYFAGKPCPNSDEDLRPHWTLNHFCAMPSFDEMVSAVMLEYDLDGIYVAEYEVIPDVISGWQVIFTPDKARFISEIPAKELLS